MQLYVSARRSIFPRKYTNIQKSTTRSIQRYSSNPTFPQNSRTFPKEPHISAKRPTFPQKCTMGWLRWVGSLKLLVGSLKLLVGSLKLLVGSLKLLVGSLKLLVGSLKLLVFFAEYRLFCKSALLKRLYPAKETYDSRSLLIVATLLLCTYTLHLTHPLEVSAVKEPYISAKEPYIFAKEYHYICTHTSHPTHPWRDPLEVFPAQQPYLSAKQPYISAKRLIFPQ